MGRSLLFTRLDLREGCRKDICIFSKIVEMFLKDLKGRFGSGCSTDYFGYTKLPTLKRDFHFIIISFYQLSIHVTQNEIKLSKDTVILRLCLLSLF